MAPSISACTLICLCHFFRTAQGHRSISGLNRFFLSSTMHVSWSWTKCDLGSSHVCSLASHHDSIPEVTTGQGRKMKISSFSLAVRLPRYILKQFTLFSLKYQISVPYNDSVVYFFGILKCIGGDITGIESLHAIRSPKNTTTPQEWQPSA